jgi:hypothetical protein
VSKSARPPNYGKPWARDELILAFDLYCRIPFSKATTKNPAVQEVARLLGRTPAAVSRKLGNFGSFDPALQERDISGLPHAGQLDREIWDEFHHDWNALVDEAAAIRRQRQGDASPVDVLEWPEGPSEKVATRKERLHQDFFRQAVLSAYENRCCVTGISLPQCLTASHIVPWNEAPRLRTDPTNGLCLSATFHRLFDAGLVTIRPGFTIQVSRSVLTHCDPPTTQHVASFHEKRAMEPSRFAPTAERLNWHAEHVFQH